MNTFGGSKSKMLMSRAMCWIGKQIEKLGKATVSRSEKLKAKAQPYVIESWSATMPSAHSLLVNFTTNKGKYHLMLEGRFIEKYKAKETEPIGEQEAFDLIQSHRRKWFKKY
jgi:hypothetical protein